MLLSVRTEGRGKEDRLELGTLRSLGGAQVRAQPEDNQQ
jgi:hypothetical protein